MTWLADLDLSAADSAKFVPNQIDRRGLPIESSVSGGCIVFRQLNRTVVAVMSRPFVAPRRLVGLSRMMLKWAVGRA